MTLARIRPLHGLLALSLTSACVEPSAPPRADATAADAPSLDASEVSSPTPDVLPSADRSDVPLMPDVPVMPDVPLTPDVPVVMVAPPRPVAPLTGAHAPSRRPQLRWSLPSGVDGARVTLCRDRALTTGCITFDVTGSTGTPPADLASGAWYWSLRGLRGGSAGAAVSATWRVVVATVTTTGARPWGGDRDLNGDGFADLIATAVDNALFVYPGGPSGPGDTPTVLPAPIESTGFGQSMNFVGDVDGDGFGDVAVGSPGSDTVYLYRGSAAGLVPTPATLAGPRNSMSGQSLAGGDFNGDGYSDVAVLNPVAGAILLFPGSVTGAGAAQRFLPPWPAQLLSSVGDFNGDGFADLLVAEGGTTRVVSGSAAGFDLASARTINGTARPAGDVNGDGLADLALDVGAGTVRLGAATGAGRDVVVLPHSTDDFVSFADGDFNGDGFGDVLCRLGSALHFVAGGASGPTPAVAVSAMGFGVPSVTGATGAGDSDGDGFDDLITRRDDLGRGGATAIYLTAGSPTGPSFGGGATSFRVADLSTPSYGGSGFAAGDLNHDGLSDLAIGSTGDFFAVFVGTAGGLATTAAVYVRPFAGMAVVVQEVVPRAAGDVDGDGFGDLAVSTRTASGQQVRLYFGAASGLRSSPALLGAAATGSTTLFAGGVGDLNGDHFADVAFAGSPAAIFYGQSGGIRTTPTVFAPAGGTVLRLEEAGDVNRDGFGDLLVTFTGGGAARVFAGSASGPGSTPMATLATAGEASAISDVDHDGYADIAVSTGSSVVVYRGAAAGLSAAPAATIASAGTAAPLGDVDGDGFADIVIQGAPAGAPAIYRGSTTGLSTRPWSEGPVYWRPVSRSAHGLGDLDGDGTADLVVLDPPTLYVQRTGRAPRPPRIVPAPPGVAFRVTQ